jgi:hypothetical protein
MLTLDTHYFPTAGEDFKQNGTDLETVLAKTDDYYHNFIQTVDRHARLFNYT